LREVQRRKPGRRLAADLWTRRCDGALKLYLTQRVLDIRRTNRDLFERGEYIPLEIAGRQRDQLCAYARRLDDREIIVVVPRLVATLAKNEPDGSEVWGNTQILPSDVSEGTRYQNVFTGEIVTPDFTDGQAAFAVADLFMTLPVACLVRLGPGET
jgi:(1->4)-alpha-D-glucan 1-alpha-D-glucosylmutase